MFHNNSAIFLKSISGTSTIVNHSYESSPIFAKIGDISSTILTADSWGIFCYGAQEITQFFGHMDMDNTRMLRVEAIQKLQELWSIVSVNSIGCLHHLPGHGKQWTSLWSAQARTKD
jgi:hypothetical protein